MKNINLIFAAATLLSCSSCITYYTVVQQLHGDGSLTETWYASADSAFMAGDYAGLP